MAGDAAELRLHGLNAILAVHARRPGAIRKLWLREDRIGALQPLLKWCAAHRVGYRVVEDEDLRKLAATTHHEGVVA
ncbi:MAG TPA: RNA methyltransferase substrate-binding domain-containing protein, partial [Xanthomonadaceae bacterium]|nr:RNA methyltransferase substrate-binding domain-containing protein [Xanthomonadaceae bacterium]